MKALKQTETREQIAVNALDKALRKKAEETDMNYILITWSKKGNVNQFTAFGNKKKLKYMINEVKKKIKELKC